MRGVRGAGWVRSFARGRAQRPWKQVERHVLGKEAGHGGAVREVKSRGHPGIPHLIPPSNADHGCSVELPVHAGAFPAQVPTTLTLTASGGSCPWEVTVGHSSSPSLCPLQR